MSREYTQILKGFAIIAMVWLHLFGKMPEAVEYSDIMLGGASLSNMLSRLCNPVSMFLALGGYGLYCVYLKAQDRHHISRIVKLYAHYWIILAIFVTIGTLMGRHYFTDVLTVLGNVTGFVTHWNYECWFLLPYSILSLAYPLVFRAMDRLKPWIVIAFTFCLSILAMVFIHFTVGKEVSPFLSLVIVLMEFLFCFCCGALAKEYGIVERFQFFLSTKSYRHIILIASFLILLLLRIVVPHASWGGLYALLLLLLLSSLHFNGTAKKVMIFLGDHSMNIWMIHTWLSNYLFHPFIYSFRYPLLIFVLTLVLSIAISYIVNFIYVCFSKCTINVLDKK